MSVVGDVLNFGLGLANAGYTIYNDQRLIDTQNAWRLQDQAREDSTLQRSRADAEKAGFSPLAALSNPVGSTASPVPVGSSSSPFGSAQSAISAASQNKLAREQAEMAKQLSLSQIDNTNADTRDKNASADVNEATTAVQILKAKAELDSMIANNNMTEAQVVRYLNDMKSEGISDSVIDSLLSQFQANPNNPTISAGDLSGNKTISGQQSLTSAQTALANANKSLADAQTALANANTASVNNQNKYWTETKAALQQTIDSAEASIASVRSLEANDRNINGTVTIIDQNGTKRSMQLSNALDYLEAKVKDAQYSLSVSKLGSDELKDSLSVLDSILGALGTIGNILGPLSGKK